MKKVYVFIKAEVYEVLTNKFIKRHVIVQRAKEEHQEKHGLHSTAGVAIRYMTEKEVRTMTEAWGYDIQRESFKEGLTKIEF